MRNSIQLAARCGVKFQIPLWASLSRQHRAASSHTVHRSQSELLRTEKLWRTEEEMADHCQIIFQDTYFRENLKAFRLIHVFQGHSKDRAQKTPSFVTTASCGSTIRLAPHTPPVIAILSHFFAYCLEDRTIEKYDQPAPLIA